jgi:hypothetical protein
LKWRFSFSVSQKGILVFQTGEALVGAPFLRFDRSGKQLGRIGEKDF